MGLFVRRWGVCGAWTGEAIPPCRGLRYQSQKTVGRMERVDSTGGFWVSGGWLLFQPLHQDPLKRSPSRLIRSGSRLSPRIGYAGQADVGAAAGGSDNSSSSLSHCGTVAQLQHLSHTTCWSRGPRAHNTHTTCLGDFERQTHTYHYWVLLTYQRWTWMLHPKLCLLVKCIVGVNWPWVNPLQDAIDKLSIFSWGPQLYSSFRVDYTLDTFNIIPVYLCRNYKRKRMWTKKEKLSCY